MKNLCYDVIENDDEKTQREIILKTHDIILKNFISSIIQCHIVLNDIVIHDTK